MEDLVTARLVLHPLTPAEAERLVAGSPDGGVGWAPGYPMDGDVRAARRFLRVCAESGDPQPFGVHEIRRREDGQAVGGLGFHGPVDDDGGVTIGYGLVPSARGKGYASEALRALLLYARTCGVTCVRGDTEHDNVASQRVMTAAGMRLVARDELLKHYEITWPAGTATTDAEPAQDPGTSSHCCETMTRQVNKECDRHDDPFDCPDMLIRFNARFQEYGLVIHDGGTASMLIGFCPWCGRRLPASQRDRWFDEMERRGIDPWEDDIPAEFQDDRWLALCPE